MATIRLCNRGHFGVSPLHYRPVVESGSRVKSSRQTARLKAKGRISLIGGHRLLDFDQHIPDPSSAPDPPELASGDRGKESSVWQQVLREGATHSVARVISGDRPVHPIARRGFGRAPEWRRPSPKQGPACERLSLRCPKSSGFCPTRARRRDRR